MKDERKGRSIDATLGKVCVRAYRFCHVDHVKDRILLFSLFLSALTK